MFKAAADAAGIPMWFAVATAMAESGLNPRAERWGGETALAKQYIAAENWSGLHGVVTRAGADISFGYGQQILLYHYAGNRTSTVTNALAVREAVFNDPQTNVEDMCRRLAANLQRVQGDPRLSYVGGDPYLGALLVYNSGSLQTDPAWWARWGGNIANYRSAIASAKRSVGDA